MTYRPRFRVTYDIVTPESAENGEAAENGFISDYGLRYETAPPCMTLREALRLVSPSYDCGRWFDEPEHNTDYRTGAVESRALHPPKNITPASYRRLARLLRVR
jgi:hypothetical protein